MTNVVTKIGKLKTEVSGLKLSLCKNIKGNCQEFVGLDQLKDINARVEYYYEPTYQEEPSSLIVEDVVLMEDITFTGDCNKTILTIKRGESIAWVYSRDEMEAFEEEIKKIVEGNLCEY